MNSLSRYIFFATLPLFLLLSGAGCSQKMSLSLMPSPLMYENGSVDPFKNLPPENQTTSISVFFATNREPESGSDMLYYGNDVSEMLHLGQADIRFGDDAVTWKTLYEATFKQERPIPIPITLQRVEEYAQLNVDKKHDELTELSTELQEFADAINRELENVDDNEIVVYVHGARGTFFHSTAVMAEIKHFSGRQFVSVAFDWPSHSSIVPYLFGEDVKRAFHSTVSLHRLLEFLAMHTKAEKINILCYSAGGKLVSAALDQIRLVHPALSDEALNERFKIGTVLFAAADVSVDKFLDRLPAVSRLAERVVVTLSDSDIALETAEVVMEKGRRIGTQEAEVIEEQYVMKEEIANFEMVDLSHAKDMRGFDITGHHYWLRHPWASSDVLLLLRSDFPAVQRGLSYSMQKGVWFFPETYPEKVRNAARDAMQRTE